MLNRLRHWVVGGLAAAAVGLLLAQPASAVFSQSLDFTHVGVNGEGDALIWPLFDVVNQDTLIAITNTSIEINGVDQNAAACVGLGCMTTEAITLNSIGRWSLVHFHVRKPDQSQDARNWTVCLSPGDVWTASMTQSGSDTLIETADLSTTSVGFPLTATGITKGYIEAVQVDVGTSQATGCDNTMSVTAHQPGFPSNGIRFANILFGEGLFVGKGTGLASGYNATAIATFQSYNSNNDIFTVDNLKSTATVAGVATPQKRAFFALTHPGLEVTVGSLKSRWFVDSSFGGDTQLVVTFPVTTAGTNALSIRPAEDMAFPGFTNCLECVAFNFNIPATMALWLRDDEENRDGQSPRQVTIGKQVNVLTLSSLLAAGTVHLPTPSATGGWLHMMVDNDENEFVDSVTGRTCDISNPGLSCSVGGGVLTWRFVPRMLDVVGFSIIQAESTSGDLLSALLPWKWNAPANTYQCDRSHTGNQLHFCAGKNIFP